MHSFIETPHLPKSKVKHLIIGEKYRAVLENALLSRGIEPVWMPDNPFVDPRLSGHCDLSIVHAGGKRLFASEYLRHTDFTDRLSALGAELEFCGNAKSAEYPHDAGLNFCILSDKLICNRKTANAGIVNKLTIERAGIIQTNQGYTKCSVCVIDAGHIISSDLGICKKCENLGIAVEFVSGAHIKLDGFGSGFIGGAAFKVAADKLAFTGAITDASVKADIEQFLNELGVSADYLTCEQTFDIGSAIPLTEYR